MSFPLSRLAAPALAAALSVAAFGASAQTLGERVASGQISQAAFVQLAGSAGLSVDEARDLTLSEIAQKMSSAD
jgi:hypothetical protein